MSDCEQVNIEEQDSETIEQPIDLAELELAEREQPKRKSTSSLEGSKSPKRRIKKEATTDTGVKKPKRKCSEKQLAALAAGREKNNHFKPKSG